MVFEFVLWVPEIKSCLGFFNGVKRGNNFPRLGDAESLLKCANGNEPRIDLGAQKVKEIG